MRGAVAALAAVALGPVASASAEPLLTIESPTSGAQLDSSTPAFRGTTQDTLDFNEENEEVFDPITVVISSAGDVVVQRVPASTQLGSGAWSAVAGPLADGSYIAQAIQTTPPPADTQVGQSEPPVPFTIDTTPPNVTISTPANGSSSTGGSQAVGGSAGTAAGDLPTITIRLFAGGSIAGQAPLETLVVQASGESWSATFGGLAPGTYTTQAAQGDQAGNTGVSAPVTFTVASPAAPPPPVASFKWFPAAPRVGEAVSLVSSSTDSFSPLTSFAWALTSASPFTAGKPVLTTSFATAGNHVVRLQVTDGEGRSSVATESVPVSGRPLVLMQPFPVVRIAGNVTSRGANVRLLTVQAPPAATVTVTCAGKGCSTKAESRIATSSGKRTGAITLSFRRFERSLPGGAVLQIRVSKPGEIGKFTSFAIRRGRLPVRSDACLSPLSSKPIPCPAS